MRGAVQPALHSVPRYDAAGEVSDMAKAAGRTPISTDARPDEIHTETVVGGTRARATVQQLHAMHKVRLDEEQGSLTGEPIMDLTDEQLRYLLALDYREDC